MGAPHRPERRKHVRRDEEIRLREIVDQMADGVVIVNTEGMVRFVNPAAEELFGRPAAELLDHPFGFPLVEGETTEIDVVHRSGEVRVAELRTVEMEWERETTLLVSLRDITDRKQAEDRLHQLLQEQAARSRAEAEERRARFLSEAGAVLDSSLDYSAVLDRLARLVVAPQFELPARELEHDRLPRLAAWCVIDILQDDGTLQRVAAVHHDPERQPLLDELRERFPPDLHRPYPALRALREGAPQLYEEFDDELLASLTQQPEHARLLRRIGLSSAMAVPLMARGHTLGAIIFACEDHRYDHTDLVLAQDLAQRAALSLANARLYQQAQSANRAKADFLAVMSHELRTPLNAITGYTEILLAELSGPITGQQKQQLERISGSSRHLLQIVEEILSFARLESGQESLHLSEVGLADLLDEVGAMIRPQAERKGLRFVLLPVTAPVRVRTDLGKARQILLNLLSNAVKFTQEGEVRLEAIPDVDAYLLRVTDTGIGIPAEHLERIFDPFWQVEQSSVRSAEGTGLGLSVARRLAEALGGSLTVRSQSGQGTTFTLRLPACLE